MAVFLTNVCKFSDCGLTFPSLRQLIEHIEESHIDNDPQFIEKQELQQPSALPLSYVIKFVTDAAKHQTEKKKARLHSSSSQSSKTIAQTLVGKLAQPQSLKTHISRINVQVNNSEWEFDDDHDKSDSDSDNSWTTPDEFSYELILRTMATQVGDDKPFVCPVPGCKKRYKNVNGMKYHAKNGHRNEKKVKKNFKCQCGKSYKTAQGLRQHRQTAHAPMSLDTPLTSLAIPKPIPSPNIIAGGSSLAAPTLPPGAAPLLAGPLGVSLANGSIVLESVTPINTGGGGLIMGSRAAGSLGPLGPLGSMTSSHQPGLIVTLPSGVDPTTVSLAQASLAAAKKVKYKQIRIQGECKE